jgi:hypothetical protein
MNSAYFNTFIVPPDELNLFLFGALKDCMEAPNTKIEEGNHAVKLLETPLPKAKPTNMKLRIIG